MHWQDNEEPDAYDIDDEVDDDPEDDQLPCPSCGRMIFDDTDRCPHCGDWVMPLAAASSRGTWVWWTALALVIVMLITWGLFG